MTTRTALYRCFDADDELLYVGIAYDPDARWKQHRARSAWAHQVSMRTIEWFDSREDAERAEREAIRFEGPRYNQRHNRPSPTAIKPQAHQTLADAYGDEGPSDAQLRRVLSLLLPGIKEAAST